MKNHRFRSVALVFSLVLCATAANATAVANAEVVRRESNTARIGKMNPYMRPKVKAVLSDLEAHGYRPLIDSGVYRTPAEQREKVRKGYSKTLYSFHNATTLDGKPDSLAADITDARWGWDSGAAYWLKLAKSAEAHDLETGIRWGLKAEQRAKIDRVLAARDWQYRGSLGWDTAHVQPKGLSVSQAKRGIRPK
jgi:hypothetical protein